MPEFQTLSANLNAPQQPYSALGDLFASGLYQAPRFNAGMQTLMPNSPASPTPPMSGLPQMSIGAAATPNTPASPYLPSPTYARAGYRR